MFTTEREIRSQYAALRQTAAYIGERKEAILNAFDETRSLCVIGCGSSYSLAKSAARQFTLLSQIPAFAVAAGDLLVNFADYESIVSNATLLLLSRSGSTSEVVQAAERCKRVYHNRVISVCAKAGSPIEATADTNLVIPWCFDESVCQTRTVTNLYLAGWMIAAIVAGKREILEAAQTICDPSEAFCAGVEATLQEIADGGWEKAVVLADGAVAGLAEEGALAFKEICRRDSNFYHVLDVRHGPMVQINAKTLVIAFVSSGDFRLQADLIADVAKKTKQLVILSRDAKTEKLQNCRPIRLPDCGSDAASAVYALYCIQMICYLHALGIGVNPDAPDGLDAWIRLGGV